MFKNQAHYLDAKNELNLKEAGNQKMFNDISTKLNDKTFLETAASQTLEVQAEGDCDCINFADTPPNCGQSYNYKGKQTPWCYTSTKCKGADGISTIDDTTPWKRCDSPSDTKAKEPPKGCGCIDFNDTPANCGQNYQYKGKATPWCYVGQGCMQFDGISTVDDMTPWKRCPSSDSTAALEDTVAKMGTCITNENDAWCSYYRYPDFQYMQDLSQDNAMTKMNEFCGVREA
jgi:hypothetical protein